MPNPLRDFAHLDLLPLARRLWRDRLESRALKYIEENVLLAPRSVEEVPGYEIPYLYFDYLRTGDARPSRGFLSQCHGRGGDGNAVVTAKMLADHSTGVDTGWT
jgi:uncharacterized protein YprB with RNaseH-like and TPR domain